MAQRGAQSDRYHSKTQTDYWQTGVEVIRIRWARFANVLYEILWKHAIKAPQSTQATSFHRCCQCPSPPCFMDS